LIEESGEQEMHESGDQAEELQENSGNAEELQESLNIQ